MSLSMVAKNSSAELRSDETRTSRQSAAIRRGVSRSDAICSSPKRAPIVFHVEKSEPTVGDTPSASVISHAFHCGRTATRRGTKDGRRVVRMVTILNSWQFGFPTALNQTAGPVVSKRITLKEGFAVSCRNCPVSLIARGSICCPIQPHRSRSHPGFRNGPSLLLSWWWERPPRALQTLWKSSISRKDATVNEEKGIQNAVGGTGPSGWVHSITWIRVGNAA